jgi:MOSC domain-containing protein YiiM
MAKILSIVYQPEDQQYESGHTADFIRVPAQTVELVSNHGIKGDRKAGGNPRRQLNLLSKNWLEAKKAVGYKVAPGQFGEQIIVEGLEAEGQALEFLREGQRLQLGDVALIEITMPRVGCERLEAAQEATGLAGTHIGVLARVVEGGIISQGDPVHVLP